MASVKLRGLSQKTVRLASGRVATYYYAWKTGPRLPGRPGSPEFVAAYLEAHKSCRAPPPAQTLDGLIGQYRVSPEFARLRPSTKGERERWFGRIGDAKIATLPLSSLSDPKTKRQLIEWRNTFAEHPRKADYAFQVLSAVLTWGVHQGLLGRNIIIGTPQLYHSNRADQIWTDDELERFAKAAPSLEVAFIVRFAALTGIRRDDLVKLTWEHVRENSIAFATGKSNGRKTAIIPLLGETRMLLEEIRSQQGARYDELVQVAERKKRPIPPAPTTVLASTRCRPWTAAGLEHQVVDTKKAAGIDKHLHDARGTFATRLCRAGVSDAEIATILGWEVARVAQVRALYVDGDRVAASIAERIGEVERRALWQ